MRAPLATLLILSLAAAARAEDAAPAPEKPAEPGQAQVSPTFSLNDSQAKTPLHETASGASPAAAFDPFASKDYSKDLAAVEKAAGRDYVWDGMKMVPAPDNFKSPLTPEAAAAGWRPVIVGGEVQGVCNGNQCTSKEMQPGLFAAPTPPNNPLADTGNQSANWCEQNPGRPPCAPKEEPKKEEPAPPAPPELNAGNTKSAGDIEKGMRDQDRAAANDPTGDKGGPGIASTGGPLGPGTGAASTERPATQPPSGGAPVGPAGSGADAMGQVGQDSSGGLGAGRQVRCQTDECYRSASTTLDAVLNAPPSAAGPSGGPGETVVESAGRLGGRRSMVQANALKRDLQGRVAASREAGDNDLLDDNLAVSAIENPGATKDPIKVRKDCKNVFGIDVVCPK